MNWTADISGDGTVVTGQMDDATYPRGYRWEVTSSNVTSFPAGQITTVRGISADGQYIAGNHFDPDANAVVPTRWDASLASDSLSHPVSLVARDSYGISGDGRTVVGTHGDAAFLWKPPDSITTKIWSQSFISLAFLTTNHDGTIAVGYGVTSSGVRMPIWWSSASSVVQLSGSIGEARGISRDGTVIVGLVNDEAVPSRWSGSGFTSRQPLPLLATSGTVATGVANATNRDGSVSVGFCFISDEETTAVIWTGTSVQRIADILVAAGANLTGWALHEAIAVTDDGKSVVGNGYYGGQFRAWLARLP